MWTLTFKPPGTKQSSVLEVRQLVFAVDSWFESFDEMSFSQSAVYRVVTFVNKINIKMMYLDIRKIVRFSSVFIKSVPRILVTKIPFVLTVTLVKGAICLPNIETIT